jgi:heat shock protein HslJ
MLPEITNKYWKLIELNGATLTPLDKQRSELHINLHVDGNRLTGSGGCNNFTGSYELKDGNRIRFAQIASTKMACIDMSNEDSFLKMLNIADNYIVKGDTLILNKARMSPLARFVAVYMK